MCPPLDESSSPRAPRSDSPSDRDSVYSSSAVASPSHPKPHPYIDIAAVTSPRHCIHTFSSPFSASRHLTAAAIRPKPSSAALSAASPKPSLTPPSLVLSRLNDPKSIGREL